PPPTESYTLSLHDALPISVERLVGDQLVDRADPVQRPVEQGLQPRGLARLPGDHVDGQGGVLVGGRQDDLGRPPAPALADRLRPDRKSTRLNSSHVKISYA